MIKPAGRKKKTAAPRNTPAQVGDSVEFVIHRKQQDFCESTAIYRGFLAGIASGKTFCGAFDLCDRAEPGKLYAIVAPTFPMLRDATLRTFMEVATKLGLWENDQDFEGFHKSEMRAVLKNGAEVLFRSGDTPGTLRGPTLAGCWLDECSQMKEEVFNVMIGRLRFGGKQGWLSATYTPAGPDHWTARVFNDDTNPNVFLVHCSTKDNPFLEPAIYENLLLQYGKGPGGRLRAEQELEGKVVVIEGAEWPMEYFGPDIWFSEWPVYDDELRVMFLDSSKGVGGKTGDYSCFCMMKWADGKLWVKLDMDNSRNTDAMSCTAVELYKSFKPHWFGIEAEFGVHFLGQSINDRAETQNVPLALVLVPTQGIPKEVRIRRLTPFITRGMIRFYDDEQTKIGLGQFQGFPHSLHDDAPDATEAASRILIEAGVFNAA